jgi:1-acyl-sn-glycerol-3-phosphate acyltransferase
MALGLRAGTMIKDSAFAGLLGPLLRWLGAIPINRRSPKGVVEQSVDAFDAQPQLLLLIAPEGTRGGAREWKRGFYLIARQAGVPVLPVACDYRRRRITFGPELAPCGDYPADLGRLLEFFRDHGAPAHPERLSKPLSDLSGRTGQATADAQE